MVITANVFYFLLQTHEQQWQALWSSHWKNFNRAGKEMFILRIYSVLLQIVTDKRHVDIVCK